MHTILKEREFLDKHYTHTEKLMQGRTRTDMSLQEQVKADLTCITPQMHSFLLLPNADVQKDNVT